ncbi:ASCH domain-containing protein [Methanolobus sp. ZRKC3]|uniref:ASCH domain-containing protein n=1 Tax=Methanolobus sp. ZRKC3 TaxID=3125786 RepID=UPI0032552120
MKENQEQIKVLAIKQPWASLIADGFKTLEVRSRNTNIRGPIAIYASRTKPKNSELEHYFTFMSGMLKPIPPLQQGQIIATAELVDSYPVGSSEAFRILAHNHHNPLSYYQDGLHFWELENVQKVEPVEFKFKGSIVWSKIDKSLLKVV